MTKGRMLLGLVTMTRIQIGAGELLPSVYGGRLSPEFVKSAVAVQAVLTAGIAAFAGGWVARRRFLLPSLALWLALWPATVDILYSIAAPTGQSSLSSVLGYNAIAIALSGVATALGAVLGQRVAAVRSGTPAPAT